MAAVTGPAREMTQRPPDRMLVLDFSGTLSLEAALYAREENLRRALEESGLWRMGVDSLAIFWDGIVNPTWQEGSTTGKGYTRLLFEQVRQIAASRGLEIPEADIWASAARFVEGYLHHSAIDPAWRPVLHRLLRHPGLVVVVATDHYAEATGHILSQLRALGLEGSPVLQGGTHRVLVANSADLGAPKASEAFWTAVQRARGLRSLAQILVVDDLGFHEQAQDAYRQQEKIARRQRDMVQVLSAVFAAPTRIFPFLLKEPTGAPLTGEEALRHEYRELIRQAGRFAASA